MAKAKDCEEIIKELDHGCKIVQLTLFRHQVSGHHVFLMYDKNKILKQLNEQERYVYENFPENLKSFVPKFYGKNVNKEKNISIRSTLPKIMA